MIADARERYRDAAIERLITSGILTDPAWRDALHDLPRDRFVTGFHVPTTRADGAPGWAPRTPTSPASGITGGVAPDPVWLGSVHGPDPLVVALSGLDPWGYQHPVSISPAPGATVSMLQALTLRSGHRVLELGTGIGHTAALLAHRLGPPSVTSVEIDPDLRRHAAVRLHALGLRPTLRLEDSAQHCDPDRYDRVLVSHHVSTVPPVWIAAVRPGGQLLLGLRGSLGAGHHALLHHHTNAATGESELTGRFLDWAATLSDHRQPARRRSVRPLDASPGPIRSSTTSLPVAQLAANTPLALFCQLHLPPGTTHAVRADADGGHSSYLHAPDGSWAEISHTHNRGRRHDLRWAGVSSTPAPTLAPTTPPVLIADTDTRNPSPATYRALLYHVQAGAALAIADYPRHWDEANLTNHLARPLIAAVTGHDVPQPLAGDIAVSPAVLRAALQAAEAVPSSLQFALSGYGIDAFLLLTAARCGEVVSVRVPQPKQHAGSFPHLPDIYRQAVPMLLHLTASPSAIPSPPAGPAPYRLNGRSVDPARLDLMINTLDALVPQTSRDADRPWPLAVARAWRAVVTGSSAEIVAHELWPHYLHRVRTWLVDGQHATVAQLSDILATAHADLRTAIRAEQGAHP